MSTDSPKRSLVKALTWRTIASIVTALIAWFFGVPAKAIGLVFFADLVIKFILYFFHERLWAKYIKFGLVSRDK
ncbi:DUF2061 domain-containing protein [SAR86 cluster bacterium]|nr:DUF2061 domain-containing protein [SAR86 cluster bacterium]